MKSNFQNEATRRFAKCWNNLDIKYVENDFADDIVYESQLVFNKLEGKDTVVNYFKSKFNTIRNELTKGTMTIKAEMANHPLIDGPLFVISQVYKGEASKICIILKTYYKKIKRIDACVIPDPESAELTGEIPR